MPHEENNGEHPVYEVFYTSNVVDFIIEKVWSERVYDKINRYQFLLAEFPDIGAPYQPTYPAARPPFSCRFISVPDTPFTMYYVKDDDAQRVTVFYIEHQGANPQERFTWELVSF